MKDIVFRPIGTIHSPFDKTEGMPVQPTSAKGVKGYVEVFPEFSEGLTDLEGFSHIILIYHFHLSEGYRLMVKPFLDNEFHGVFATRAPRRPNQAGLSVVKLTGRKENILYAENLDIINGTPLIDIKPYVPLFDAADGCRTGWVSGKDDLIDKAKNDKRFDIKG